MAKQLWVIWSAFIGSVIIYPVIAYLFLPNDEPKRNILYLAIFGILAVASVVVSVIYKTHSLYRLFEIEKIDLNSEAGIQQIQSSYIIVWALSEVSAILGICWVVITQDFIASIPFYMLSLVLLCLNYPKIKQ